MGLDVHCLNFLLYAKRKQAFKDTIMLGRQENHLPVSVTSTLTAKASNIENERYSEWIFEETLEANSISSLDNSDYEGATHLADMSENLPEVLTGCFDTVFDGGVLEHIYNAPQALINVSKLCRKGGQIIHVLPSNNYCGHGFWQFSPELFFSLYSEKNGYRHTEVFLASLNDTKQWFRVKKPISGKRTSSLSSEPLYVLVRTVRDGDNFSHVNVQQSDYIHAWSNSENVSTAQTDIIKRRNSKTFAQRIRGVLLPKALRRRQEKSLSKWNPSLEKVQVSDLLQGPRKTP